MPPTLLERDIAFAHSWLERVNSSAIKDYKSNIKFAMPMQLAINRFRYNHGEMEQLNANSLNHGNTYGFYIMAADETGVVVPCADRVIMEKHKQYYQLHHVAHLRNLRIIAPLMMASLLPVHLLVLSFIWLTLEHEG